MNNKKSVNEIADELIVNKYYFSHLNFANQSYIEHFKDSIYYSFVSFKSSFYFLWHSFWPDHFQQSGSNEIHKLSEMIKNKYNIRMNEINAGFDIKNEF